MSKLDGNQSPGPMIRSMWQRFSKLPGGKLLFSKALIAQVGDKGVPEHFQVLGTPELSGTNR